MKIGYFGSPAISAELLKAILDASEHEVVCVVSNADRPRGRSGKLQPTEVSALALDRGLPLFRFESIKGAEPAAELAACGAELFVVFAYGKIMPAAVYDLPPEGSVNLHASLLPDLRGASPIQGAILNGFTRTGWTVQYIAEKMDAGDIISQCEVPVGPDQDTEELTAKMLPEGIHLLKNTLSVWDYLKIGALAQDQTKATYCKKIEPDDALLDWSLPAGDLHNRIRAFSPKPLAWTMGPAGRIKVHRSRPLIEAGEAAEKERSDDAAALTAAGVSGEDQENIKREPGTILVGRVGKKFKMLVVTGAGFLEILILQPENRKKMTAADFLNGSRVKSGDRLIKPEL